MIVIKVDALCYVYSWPLACLSILVFHMFSLMIIITDHKFCWVKYQLLYLSTYCIMICSWIYLLYSGCCWPSYKTLIGIWFVRESEAIFCYSPSLTNLFTVTGNILHYFWNSKSLLAQISDIWSNYYEQRKLEWNSWAYVGTIRAPESRYGLYVCVFAPHIYYTSAINNTFSMSW